MRGLRIFIRILKETYASIMASGLSNFVVISILAVALALFGGVLQLNSAIKQISSNLNGQLEFSVYLKDIGDAKQIATDISKLEKVEKVELISKDIAWTRFRQKYDFSENSGNPLPNTIHVNITSPQDLDKVVANVKKMKGVDQISYATELFNGLERVRSILFSFGIFLTIILGVSTTTIVSNTIQLVIKSRGLEIEILRLMGVDDWYIRGPFIFHGIFFGLCSAIFAIVPLVAFQVFIWGSYQKSFQTIMPATFNFNSGNDLVLIFLAIALLGMLTCGTSSFLTTEKYIKA